MPNKKQRTAAPSIRHRRDNEPVELEVTHVPTPDPKELGTLSRYTHEILAGGPRALIAAEHKAADMAKRLGIELEKHWLLTTPYLESLLDGSAAAAMSNVDEPERARVHALQRQVAQYALVWRPRYLAVLSLSRSNIYAARAAKVSHMTPRKHRKLDPEFDAQCLAAEEYAIQLLHDVTMKSAIEGECEPVFWQGIQVGHVRKIDNRLRIEMLRAYMPKVFKTPGTKIDINQNTHSNTFICTPEEQDKLIALRRESLERMNPVTAPAALPAPASTA